MSSIYGSFTLVEDAIAAATISDHSAICKRIQFFISDPNRLRILATDQAVREEGLRIKSCVKESRAEQFIIHGSYLIANMDKPFQKHLLKQEIGIAKIAGATAYVIHSHSADQMDVIQDFRRRNAALLKGIHLVVENTSHAIPKAKQSMYKRKMLKQFLILDTAHLYSSGLAENSEQALAIIKQAMRKRRLFGIHLNDQEAPYGRGLDRHKAIGQGLIFYRYAEQFFNDSDLIGFAARSGVAVVLEYTGSSMFTDHFLILDVFAGGKVSFDSGRLIKCAGAVQAMADLLAKQENANPYRVTHYEATAAQLREIGEKEDVLLYGSADWKRYQLTDRLLGILFYTLLVQDSRTNAPVLRAIQDSRISFKQAKRLFSSVCKELRLREDIDAFACGSLRRGCGMIKDIDILAITPSSSAGPPTAQPTFKSADGAGRVRSTIAKQSTGDEQVTASPSIGNTFIKNIRERIDKSQLISYQHAVQPSGGDPHVLRLKAAGINVDLYLATDEEKATMQLFLTGNKFFNISMRLMAKRKGFKLSGQSLLRGVKKVITRSEQDVFASLDIPYVAPRYRSMWLTEH